VRSIYLLLCVLASAIGCAAQAEDAGQAWLDAQKEAPAINASGVWDSVDWGTVYLTQAEGSREVKGDGGGYDLTGVVSGKELFLLFHAENGKVEYCATLTPGPDNVLSGRYERVRRSHRRLCAEEGTLMHLTKNGAATEQMPATGGPLGRVPVLSNVFSKPCQPCPRTECEAAPATSRVVIGSNPDGADIEIDNSFVGNTPSTLEIGVGEHSVVVRKRGFEIWTRKLKVSGGEIRLSAELEKENETNK